MEMEEQYGITDLTHYMSGGRPVFTAVPPPNHLLSAVGSHHHAVQQHHYDQMVMAAAAAAAGGGGGGEMLYRGGGGGGGSDHSTNNTAANSITAGCGGGLEMEIGGGDGGNGRWPRQETLTLLEVRSRLDSKFKEANQKGPLWDEVSRMMCEEHGYQRSGKKCREKFENLYKYYKKTKEGKAGRQDGKHYRFFRQLEALYGETSSGNNISASFPDTHSNLVIGTSSFQAPPQPSSYRSHDQIPFQAPPRLCCDSLSLSTSSPFDSSSSDSMENQMRTKRGDRKRSWKVKIKEFIDSQMTKLMEKQEEWLQKMMKTIEHKEQERILREEEWRREEAARIDREHKFWANERAWMEARDAAFMEALHRLTESKAGNASPDHDPWEETEITRLMHLRRGMEASFRQGGCPEEVLWEEVSAKMACLGYDRNGSMCKAKWDSVNSHLAKTKKQKESTRSSSNQLYANINYDPRLVADCEEDDLRHHHHHHHHHQGASPPLTSTTSTPPCHVNENGYRFLIGDPENVWESYGMKLTKQGGGSQ